MWFFIFWVILWTISRLLYQTGHQYVQKINQNDNFMQRIHFIKYFWILCHIEANEKKNLFHAFKFAFQNTSHQETVLRNNLLIPISLLLINYSWWARSDLLSFFSVWCIMRSDGWLVQGSARWNFCLWEAAFQRASTLHCFHRAKETHKVMDVLHTLIR